MQYLDHFKTRKFQREVNLKKESEIVAYIHSDLDNHYLEFNLFQIMIHVLCKTTITTDSEVLMESVTNDHEYKNFYKKLQYILWLSSY